MNLEFAPLSQIIHTVVSLHAKGNIYSMFIWDSPVKSGSV